MEQGGKAENSISFTDPASLSKMFDKQKEMGMIKKILWVSIFFLIIGVLGMIVQKANAFTIMDHVFRTNQLEEAEKAALEKNQAIVFLYTYEDTTCGLNKTASMDVMEFFKDRAAVVYVCSRNKAEKESLPGPVREALDSERSGKYVPKTIVFSPQTMTVMEVIPYVKDETERKRLMQETMEKISARISGRE